MGAISGAGPISAWPVGAVYTSVVSTSPATLFGGTWAAFGAGRVLVGIDATQAEFDVVEEIGGAKTHTLTTAEMPAHTHSYTTDIAGGTTIARGVGADVAIGSAATSSTGGGGAHNNLQPYVVVYFWKRTA